MADFLGSYVIVCEDTDDWENVAFSEHGEEEQVAVSSEAHMILCFWCGASFPVGLEEIPVAIGEQRYCDECETTLSDFSILHSAALIAASKDTDGVWEICLNCFPPEKYPLSQCKDCKQVRPMHHGSCCLVKPSQQEKKKQ